MSAGADALELMRTRCREMEAVAQQEIEHHRSQLAMADSVILELDNKTAAQEETIRQLQAQLHCELEERDRLQNALDDMRGAFERTQEQLRASEERASAAEAWIAKLHTEIACALGELPAGGPAPEAERQK